MSHLFFVDGMVLFVEASLEQASIINNLLDIFCQASGQKIYMSKSYVQFSGNIPPDSCANIGSILGFDKTQDLEFYLGIPAINGRATHTSFEHVL